MLSNKTEGEFFQSSHCSGTGQSSVCVMSDCFCITCFLFFFSPPPSVIKLSLSQHESSSRLCHSHFLSHLTGGKVSERLGQGLPASQGQSTTTSFTISHFIYFLWSSVSTDGIIPNCTYIIQGHS